MLIPDLIVLELNLFDCPNVLYFIFYGNQKLSYNQLASMNEMN